MLSTNAINVSIRVNGNGVYMFKTRQKMRRRSSHWEDALELVDTQRALEHENANGHGINLSASFAPEKL
jgi:hypothetical protein